MCLYDYLLLWHRLAYAHYYSILLDSYMPTTINGSTRIQYTPAASFALCARMRLSPSDSSCSHASASVFVLLYE